MKSLVFFLEERSAEEMLKGPLPQILDEQVQRKYIIFHGKQDLEKNLLRKLRGWRTPNTVFVVIRDNDSGDCRTIKRKLLDICSQAGKEDVLVRIACQELESFYRGDLEAVEKGFGISGLAKKQKKQKFHKPDRLGSPSRELERLTKKKYQKVSGSRAIGPHLKLEGNKSHSFNVLLAGIRRMLEE